SALRVPSLSRVTKVLLASKQRSASATVRVAPHREHEAVLSDCRCQTCSEPRRPFGQAQCHVSIKVTGATPSAIAATWRASCEWGWSCGLVRIDGLRGANVSLARLVTG